MRNPHHYGDTKPMVHQVHNLTRVQIALEKGETKCKQGDLNQIFETQWQASPLALLYTDMYPVSSFKRGFIEYDDYQKYGATEVGQIKAWASR